MTIDLLRLVSGGSHARSLRSASRRIAAGTGLVVILCLCAPGCSGGGNPGQPQAPATPENTPAQSQPQPPPAPKDTAAQTAESADEDLPPIVKTPWKGDLDEMARRRVVRVLVPFRRPEFFYMEGRPAGILQEAFQELEKVLNAKYKTTAANRIIVGLLPTPMDRLRDRMAGGYGDIAAASISITEANKAIVDFTIPTMTGLKIVTVTGPGAPELKSVEDLSGKEVWVMPQTHMKKVLDDLNARLQSQGKPLQGRARPTLCWSRAT